MPATPPPPPYTILAADKLAESGLQYIRDQPDATLLDKPGLSEAEYAKVVAGGGVHAMFVRSGIQGTAEGLADPGDLKVIARAGVGVDNIDLQAATDKGILVVNTAEASTVTTAEHAFSLLCALARNIGPAYRTMAEGGWDRGRFQGTQLAGKTLGVVGFGRIGQTLATRALAFDMQVVAYDPFIASETMLDGRVRMFRDFPAILPLVDVLSFHVPLNDQTRGMLNAETFKACRPGVLVVNAARGGVVDEGAVIPAIESGQCGGAALDVFTAEPPPSDSPLRTHPKVLVTPHLGASTKEAQLQVSTDAGAACLAYLRGEGIQGAVNAGGFRVDLNPLQKAYVDLADRMASLLAPMITRGIASVRVEIGSNQLDAACGTIERTVLVGLLRHHVDAPVNVINVGQVAAARGIQSTVTAVESDADASPRLTVEVQGPAGAVDALTPTGDETRRVVGRVYDDGRPRVVEINRYAMDMVPDGHMVLLQNEDRPGMIALVGKAFGDAGVNIADMTISRRDLGTGRPTALMTLKIDAAPPEGFAESVVAQPGILKVAAVKLASLEHASAPA